MQGDKEVILFDKVIECCGCEACAQICPVSAISMVIDGEGYLYPQINKDKCIGCKKCLSVCPLKNNGYIYEGDKVQYE